MRRFVATAALLAGLGLAPPAAAQPRSPLVDCLANGIFEITSTFHRATREGNWTYFQYFVVLFPREDIAHAVVYFNPPGAPSYQTPMQPFPIGREHTVRLGNIMRWLDNAAIRAAVSVRCVPP